LGLFKETQVSKYVKEAPTPYRSWWNVVEMKVAWQSAGLCVTKKAIGYLTEHETFIQLCVLCERTLCLVDADYSAVVHWAVW